MATNPNQAKPEPITIIQLAKASRSNSPRYLDGQIPPRADAIAGANTIKRKAKTAANRVEAAR